MSDTAIAITAGTGTNIDTRTEATNGNHRQVVVLGDPSTNAGVAPVDATKGLAVDLSATGANTNKLLVTPDLPSGASTAAKQPALGTAGSASADVITVQGVTSMTALKTDSSATTQPVSGTVTANLGTIAGVSTAAKQPALGTAGTASSDVLTIQGISSMTKLLVTADLPALAATSTKQSDGSQKTQIVDGSGNVISATANALDVNIKSESADLFPATQNITVIDSASSTATGANNQSIVIGTPTAGSAASFSLSSIETIQVEVTGIWTGTLTSEFSMDGGTTWTLRGLHQGAYTTSSFTAGFIGGANMAGATNFRMRATATITGTAVVKISESFNTQSVYIANAAPSGTVVSVLNSSTATLTSGSVFTGTGEDVTNFSEMRVSVTSNVASATDGLSLQQSPDNSNWDITDTYTISAATAKTIVVPRQARYFRIVYTNGGTNQGSFRLQSILNRTATAPSSQRATDGYTNETDLVQNQVFPMEFNGTTWDRVRGDTTNGLDVDVTRLPSLVAGTAVIGHVIADSGSTTVVTGNVATTVADAANSTLGAKADAKSTATDTTAISAMSVLKQISASVQAPPSQAVTNAGTFATQSAITAASGAIASGAIASGAVASGAVASGAFASGSIAVGAVAAGATSFVKLEDVASADADAGVPAMAIRKATPANSSGTDGDYEMLQISAGRLWASATIDTALPAGSAAIGTVGASTATGSAVPANAFYAGGIAKTANPSAASDGNLTGILLDKLGKQVVVGSIRDLKVNQVTTITTSAAETTVLTAVASTFLDVYGVIVTNTSATAVTVAFKDSTSGTTQFNIAVPAGDTRGFMLPEGGAMKQGTVNNNWTATTQSVTSVVITILAVKNI